MGISGGHGHGSVDDATGWPLRPRESLPGPLRPQRHQPGRPAHVDQWTAPAKVVPHRTSRTSGQERHAPSASAHLPLSATERQIACIRNCRPALRLVRYEANTDTQRPLFINGQPLFIPGRRQFIQGNELFIRRLLTATPRSGISAVSPLRESGPFRDRKRRHRGWIARPRA